MTLIRLVCLGLSSMLFYLPAKGQNNAVYPDQFGAYFNNMHLVTPSYFPKDVKVNLSLSYKTRTGALNKISTFNVAFTRVFNHTKSANHLLRIYFYNEKDGPYIHRPRAYLNYGYKIALSKNMNIAAGAAFGFAQTAFTAPSSTANGNSISPDASIGLSVQAKKFEAGFSVCQLLNSEVNPVVAPIIYQRYYNTYLSYNVDLSPFVNLKSGMLWRALPSYEDDVNFYSMLEYKETIAFGGSYRYNKNFSFVVSTNIHIGKESILLSFVYNTPFFTKLPAWTDSVELNGGYNFY